MRVQNGATGKVSLQFPPNINRYYLLRALGGSHGLFLAAVPSLWRDAVMDLHDIARLEVWYSAIIIPLYFLGGVFADLVGRRLALVCGLALLTCGEAAYVMACCQWQILTSEFLLAAGWSLYLPAEVAMLRDSLSAGGCAGSFEAVRARGFACGLVTSSFAMTVGGFLAATSARTPAALATIFMTCAAISAACFDEPKRNVVAAQMRLRDRFKILTRMVRNQLVEDRELQRLMALGALLGISGLMSFLFMQAYCFEQGLSARCFGVVSAASSLLAAAIAKYVPAMERRIGFRALAAVALAAMFLPLLTAGAIASPLCVMLFVVQAFGRAFSEVALSARINARTRSEDCASVNALGQIVFRVLAMVFCALMCAVPIRLGAQGTYLIAALAVLVVLSICVTVLKPARTEESIGVAERSS